MKINSSNNYRKKLLYAFAGIIFVAGVILAYLYIRDNNNERNTINYGEATEEQRNAGEQAKEEAISRDTNVKTDSATNDDTELPNTPSNIPITITSTNQTSEVLQIRTRIDVVTNDGTCSIKLQQGGSVIGDSSSVQALPNTSTCKGFDIPLSKLRSGTWNITVEFKNAVGTGKTTKEINITI